MSNNKRRRCVFNQTLQADYKYIKVTKSESNVHCETCNADFNISHSGRGDIEHHIKSGKHQNALKASSSSRPMTSFFKKAEPSKYDQQIAACEGVWAYHLICENHSFRSSDCASKMIRNCFSVDKFHCGRTKCEAIVTNVIAPYEQEQLKKILEKSRCVTLLTDASNHTDIKMFPVLVRFFVPTEGIQIKMLELTSEKGETSDIIVELLKKSINKYNISSKLVGFCGDNTNTNFGGEQRRGQVNVYFKLKQEYPSLIGVGCAAHIVHNAMQCGCNGLPFDIELIVVKIYSHFYIFTVRIAKLMQFCESVEVEYQKLLGYSKTRFLALLSSVGSIIRIYDGLKEYFEETENSPKVLRDFFQNPCSKLWLMFIQDQVSD